MTSNSLVTIEPTETTLSARDLVNSAEARRLCGGIDHTALSRWEADGIIPRAIRARRLKYWKRGPLIEAIEKLVAGQQ
jgi:hypothetical protein